MREFTITSKIEYKDYLKLNYKILYSKPLILLLSIIGAVFIVVSVVMFVTRQYEIFNSDYYSFGVGFAIWTLLIPLSILLRARSIFKSNHMLQENITYTFAEDAFIITGESFNSKVSWDKLFKIKGMNGWLLVYQSKATMNMIKVDDKNGADLMELRKFLVEGGYKLKIQL